MSGLTEAQRKLLLQLPDSGWTWQFKLDRRVLPGLIRRGLVEKTHTDGLGQKEFDGYCRTRAARAALWPDCRINNPAG
jgi:hypothetical protein